CACYGHASRCSNDLQSICECVHNTQGDRCNECLPLYNNKPWRRGISTQANPCIICNCNNHADSCVYNATLDPFPDSFDSGGGGVCTNCQDNTEGRYCESCSDGYYRPAGVSPSNSSPCTPCNCDSTGSTGPVCIKAEGIPGEVVGQCPCRDNVRGRACDECADGFFNLTAGCQSCHCNTDGTIGGSVSCNENTGKCSCKLNVEGLRCDQC
ncbi:PREDICTED: usherin-like, partial [Amphimedon queenslandica]|uniref:Laminin EGF-like domain-containing protein n=2 Tax=Amphimedon queenslandica TaxID=400682 RepID=A0AAN0K274_AMPQE